MAKEKGIVETRTVESTLYGGSGGSYWDDGLYSGVKKITLYVGSCVDSIAVEYYRHDETITTHKHGGSGGHMIAPITLAPHEFIKTVSGHIGAADWTPSKPLVIRSLTFVTNLRTYGPFGETKGEDKFSFSVKDGDKIIGFFGRSGTYVDAIGFHVSKTESHCVGEHFSSKHAVK